MSATVAAMRCCKEPNLHILFGIGIDRHRLACASSCRMRLTRSVRSVMGRSRIGRTIASALHRVDSATGGAAQRPYRRDVHGDVALPVRPVAHRVGEAPRTFSSV